MSHYIINGKTAVGWRIDKLAIEEGESQALGLDFLRDYVAFVREKPVAEQIVALLNESEATQVEPRAAPSPALPREAPEPGGTLTGPCHCGQKQIGASRWIVDGHGPWWCPPGEPRVAPSSPESPAVAADAGANHE